LFKGARLSLNINFLEEKEVAQRNKAREVLNSRGKKGSGNA